MPFTYQLALLAIAGAAIGEIMVESKQIVRGWSTTTKVLYGITVVVAITTESLGLMAAGMYAAAATMGADGSRRKLLLRVSDLCGKTSAAFSDLLFIVVIGCYLGSCAAGVVAAAGVACVLVVVWMWVAGAMKT